MEAFLLFSLWSPSSQSLPEETPLSRNGPSPYDLKKNKLNCNFIFKKFKDKCIEFLFKLYLKF